MAVVALTDAEKSTLMGDQEFKESLQQKVLAKVAYYMGIADAANVQAQKNRKWSAEIEQNPSILTGDGNLNTTFVINMLTRSFANKDNTNAGTLAAQTMDYLNASSRIDFLVDDYFLDRTSTMIH